MNHKVILRSVFVLAIALALASVSVRTRNTEEIRPATAVQPPPAEPSSRALASYRVRETKADRGMDYVGANYKASITEARAVFGAVAESGALAAPREFTVEFGSPRIEQGSLQLECRDGRFERPSHGIARVHRGAVTEEYIFENRRIEQLYRIPVALSVGALRVCFPVQTDLGGPIVAHSPAEEGFKDFRFQKGGLEFTDYRGEMKLAYYGAVAIDADGRRVDLVPRYERAEIVLEVPQEFMAEATYPLVIDPWLDMGVGVTTGFRAAEKPAMAGNVIAWADNSTGNFDIYVVGFNGEDFVPFGTSTAAGGISANPGRSVNPTVALDGKGQPIVAWEDNSSTLLSIFVKKWNQAGLTWSELGTSATGTGLSTSLGSNFHPSIAIMAGVVPGQVSIDATTGLPISQPPSFPDIPVVTWSAGGNIVASAFYPGAPAIPPVPAIPGSGRVAVPAGWYPLGTFNGTGVVAGDVLAINGGDYPSIVVDSSNRPAIAYENTGAGNYEILVSRWTFVGAPASTRFQVVANATNSGFDILPSANFTTQNASNTTNPSQRPSLGADGTSLTVAWQETESAASPAPPGVTSQIYVTRSVGGGAFGVVGAGGGAPGGISDTLALATTPSLAVGAGYIAVAWADTSNGRSSIYVRRIPLAGLGGAWEQVGFQGSAFPPAFVGEPAPIGGVSQSPNFAIQPQVQLNASGSPSVVWADGAVGLFNILGKVFVGNAPGVASGVGTNNPTFNVQVQQSATNPATLITPIAPGGFSAGTSVWLFARVFTETVTPPSTTLRLEIEIQPAGVGFTGTPNVPQTLFVAPDNPTNPTLGNLAVIEFAGLPNFNYHWRARTIDQIGRASPWVSPGEVAGVSFRIDGGAGSGPPNTTPLAGAGAGRSKGSCGLTGLEAVALLGVAALIRRRRAM